MQKDLPVLEALVQDFVVFDHLIRFFYSAHVHMIVADSLRSGNRDLVVHVILYTILGKSVAGSITVSRMNYLFEPSTRLNTTRQEHNITS